VQLDFTINVAAMVMMPRGDRKARLSSAGEGFAADATVMEANASRHGKAPDELDWTNAQRQKRAVAEYLAAVEQLALIPVLPSHHRRILPADLPQQESLFARLLNLDSIDPEQRCGPARAAARRRSHCAGAASF
jgi:hypothetical protein